MKLPQVLLLLQVKPDILKSMSPKVTDLGDGERAQMMYLCVFAHQLYLKLTSGSVLRNHSLVLRRLHVALGIEPG